LITDQEINVVKIIAPDPLSIGGTDNSIREKVTSWEADIKYHENYLYDTGLIPGAYYIRRGEVITKFEHHISDKVRLELNKLLWDKIKEEAGGIGGQQYQQYITRWANLLNQPIPNLKRLSVDIEVESEEGRMPSPRNHDRAVIAVGLVGNDGFRKVLVLDGRKIQYDIPFIPEAEICSTEKELLQKAFKIIDSYPIIITYNGDDFDLPYLYARSQDARIDPISKVAVSKNEVPILVKRETFVKRGSQAEPVQTRHGLHIDLFRTFQNRSVQLYAFSHKYSEFTLNAISEALLNEGKIEFEGDISDLPIQRLAEYCLKDADYPSIIKVHNLSYETVNCPHTSCKIDPIQHIPETTHWICKEKRGITSFLIGSLRDLRVNYYKQLSKDKTLSYDERQLYGVVSQAIKVILNATYGVMGAEIFPLYCLPIADATAAIGRTTIARTIEKCKQIGIDVIYGDTDSLFLKNPSNKRVDEIASWARKVLGVDLEIDKQYRYVVFSDLKKNYLGVLADGTVDVKGLTGKKSHTPPFIRKAFYNILNILSKVNSENDFESAKQKIKTIIQENAYNLEQRKIPLEELTFNVMINKSPDKYGKAIGTNKAMSLEGRNTEIGIFKGLPQHIKAAKLLVDIGREMKAGDIVSYVKTKTGDGVKPVELTRPEEVDTEKYLETMESTLDQLLSSLNFNFKSLLGKPRQSNLDELFWR
jgi:DNA polymerase elongation subunit (family B)